MEQNVYVVYQSLDSVEDFVLSVCELLRGEVSMENLVITLMHIGPTADWDASGVDIVSMNDRLSRELNIYNPPKVMSYHMTGYRDFACAAKMCGDIIKKGCLENCAVMLELGVDIRQMVEVSDALVKLLNDWGRQNPLECMVFYTNDMTAVVRVQTSEDVGFTHDSLKSYLLRALASR